MGNTIESNQNLYKAYEFAKKKHEGQVRKFSREPYVNHPKRVMDTLVAIAERNKLELPVDIFISALLYDTLEDTDCTEGEILTLFGEDVAGIVLALTNDKEKLKEMGKTAYLVEKVNGLTSDQLLVKLADRFDNVSDGVTPENVSWFKGYAKQTREVFFDSFVNEGAMKPMHVQLKQAILEKIERGEEMVINFEKQQSDDVR